VALLPVTGVAYHSSTTHVAIETAATLVGLLVAVLFVGRFLRAPMEPDLVLAASLLLLAMTNLCFAVIPWISDDELGSFDTWAPIAGRLVGAAGIAVGAVMAPRPVWHPRRAFLHALWAVAAVLVVIGVVTAALAPHLPVGIDPDMPPDPSGPDLVGEPSVLASQVIAMLLYATAAFGFARRATRTADELMTWLAAAATIAVFSRLSYFLFPSGNSEWVYAGDFLRLTFYALILIGGLREISAYQREIAELAVHRERRRIARELHDGIAQELAFIRSQAHRLRPDGEEPASNIMKAAERALDESRHAIATLARPVNSSLDISVAQAAEEVAARDGIAVQLHLEPGLQVPDAVHDALARIVREAMGNAVRHGDASSVEVTLARTGRLHLVVEDNGAGLRDDHPNGTGFGLVSMRERAEALGGTVQLSPGSHRGARLEVRLP
jgi:signal transduction histidine kinase